MKTIYSATVPTQFPVVTERESESANEEGLPYDTFGIDWIEDWMHVQRKEGK
jgi:hypothetical protein